MLTAAVFSPCHRYRYVLTREWIGGEGHVMFVMLNPSIASGERDDPTIWRCVNFARSWGYEGLIVCNLFALVATEPRDMLAADDPVGPDNDAVLQAMADGAACIVAAWGAHGGHRGRDVAVQAMLPPLHCLRLTKGGQEDEGNAVILQRREIKWYASFQTKPEAASSSFKRLAWTLTPTSANWQRPCIRPLQREPRKWQPTAA